MSCWFQIARMIPKRSKKRASLALFPSVLKVERTNRDNLGSFSAKGQYRHEASLLPLCPRLTLRLSIIHFERFSMQVVPVEFFFGRVGCFYRIHLDEAEAL